MIVLLLLVITLVVIGVLIACSEVQLDENGKIKSIKF